MSPTSRLAYFCCLYGTLGLIAIANLFFGSLGSGIPWFSVAIQAFVMVSAILKQPWSRYVVIIWCAICIIGALAAWLAVLVRGSFSFSPGVMVWKSVLLFVCTYLAVGAPDAFSTTTQSAESAANEA